MPGLTMYIERRHGPTDGGGPGTRTALAWHAHTADEFAAEWAVASHGGRRWRYDMLADFAECVAPRPPRGKHVLTDPPCDVTLGYEGMPATRYDDEPKCLHVGSMAADGCIDASATLSFDARRRTWSVTAMRQGRAFEDYVARLLDSLGATQAALESAYDEMRSPATHGPHRVASRQ